MKFLACGCFHGKIPKRIISAAKGCDFILSTGDFGGSEKMRKVIFRNFNRSYIDRFDKKKLKQYYKEDYFSGISTIRSLDKLGKKIYTIDGNWDFTSTADINKEFGLEFKPYSSMIRKTQNIKFMNKKIRRIEGLKIYPHGGLMPASIFHERPKDDQSRKAYLKWHRKQSSRLFRQKAKGIDIMLAHCPPYMYFDKVVYKGVNPMNGKHVGFRPYNEYIKRYKPRLFICGHMHEHQGIKRLGRTIILSHGAAQDGKAAVVEWTDGKIKIRLIR